MTPTEQRLRSLREGLECAQSVADYWAADDPDSAFVKDLYARCDRLHAEIAYTAKVLLASSGLPRARGPYRPAA